MSFFYQRYDLVWFDIYAYIRNLFHSYGELGTLSIE